MKAWITPLNPTSWLPNSRIQQLPCLLSDKDNGQLIQEDLFTQQNLFALLHVTTDHIEE